MPNNTDFSTELLRNNSNLNQIILTVITKYYYAQFSKSISINTDFSGSYHQLYQLFQCSYQTIPSFSESPYQTKVNTFFRLYIEQYSHIQSCYKIILYTFFRIHFKQYWQFQRVSIKQWYMLFQSSYQPIIESTKKYWFSQNSCQLILIFSRSYYHKKQRFFSEFIPNNTDTFRESLLNSTAK